MYLITLLVPHSPKRQYIICFFIIRFWIFSVECGECWFIFRCKFIFNNFSQASSIPSRPRTRKTRNKRLAVNVYGSSSDLAADTPISTYVRRKTPGTSPTSPIFNRDSGYESSSSTTAMPFSIPSLPVLFLKSSSSESFPTSDSELEDVASTSPKTGAKRLPDLSKSSHRNRRIVRRPTGVRISVPSHPTNVGEHLRRRSNNDIV